MGGLSGIIAGLVGSGMGEKSIDMSQLLQTIQSAGQYQQSIINALPAQIQQNLAKYAASLSGAGEAFKGNIQGLGTNLMQNISSLYGPTSEAAQAAKTAAKQDIYSTLPGTDVAVRNALAATGGLNRGQAGTALAAPAIGAARQYGQVSAGINAQQTAAQQQAKQQALMIINSMDAGMFQQLFGMSQQQAITILNTGNTALQNQLIQLLQQSQTQTNQTLGVEGIQAQNAYQNALQQQGYQSAIYNGLANMGVGALSGGFSGVPGFGLPPGADVTSAAYTRNAALNNPDESAALAALIGG